MPLALHFGRLSIARIAANHGCVWNIASDGILGAGTELVTAADGHLDRLTTVGVNEHVAPYICHFR